MKPGEMLGPYRVVSELGAGGMGQVYRARDTKLDRDVAIKILPESFSADPDRLMRFEREAKALASLNHPNIAQIYGIEDRAPLDDAPGAVSASQTAGAVSGSRTAIVMELVEGEDLSERMARGAMALDDALPIVRQVADALEAAHAQGIVHRDLKPANIKVRPDGVVKVLDFGLAKAVEGDGSRVREQDPSPSPMESPTMTSPAGTEIGMILGTAAYMAPEQARGRSVDHRADIWAFGVVLAEMLTGRHAFKGDDITETLAAVVKSPPNLDGLPPDSPEAVRRLLRRCLEKDPRKRLSSIADARLELDDAAADAQAPAGTPVSVARPSFVARLWPALAGVVVTLAAVAAFSPWNRTAGDDGLTRTTILTPPETRMAAEASQAAISPDGTMVVLTVTSSGGSELWVRALDSATPRRLDVGGAFLPFWKPDSSRIGFFTFDGKLKTIAVAGGRAEELCDAPNARGGTWSVSDVIVFAPDATGPLYRVPATGGGACEPATGLDAAKKQDGHRFPTMLPDGEHFLYAAMPRLAGKFDVFVGSLLDDSIAFVDPFESAPAYAEPGWLLFAHQRGLAAQAFDAGTLTLSGTAIALDDEPGREWNPNAGITAAPVVSISQVGSLVYTSASWTDTTVVWHDRQGLRTGTFDLPSGRYESVRIAPDGVHAVLVRAESPSESTLWVADLAREGASPLLTGPGRTDSPVWSPEGDRVAFTSDRDGPQNIYVIGIDGTAEERLIHESDVTFRTLSAWSAGPEAQQWIVVTQLEPDVNLRLLSPAGGEMKPFLTRPFPEAGGVLDPTGRWMAYLSAESGQMEVHLQSFPEPGEKVPVTRQGAFLPSWLSDGRLMFRGADRLSMWEVDLGDGLTPRPGTPRLLATFPDGTMWIEPLVDGRFLSIVPESTEDVTVTLVRNWLKALPGRRP